MLNSRTITTTNPHGKKPFVSKFRLNLSELHNIIKSLCAYWRMNSFGDNIQSEFIRELDVYNIMQYTMYVYTIHSLCLTYPLTYLFIRIAFNIYNILCFNLITESAIQPLFAKPRCKSFVKGDMLTYRRFYTIKFKNKPNGMFYIKCILTHTIIYLYLYVYIGYDQCCNGQHLCACMNIYYKL